MNNVEGSQSIPTSEGLQSQSRVERVPLRREQVFDTQPKQTEKKDSRGGGVLAKLPSMPFLSSVKHLSLPMMFPLVEDQLTNRPPSCKLNQPTPSQRDVTTPETAALEVCSTLRCSFSRRPINSVSPTLHLQRAQRETLLRTTAQKIPCRTPLPSPHMLQ